MPSKTDVPQSSEQNSVPFSVHDWPNLSEMKILIVGAGLSGLLFATLCQRMGIQYDIFERSDGSKRSGGVMSINSGILPALEQLGIYEKLVEKSYPVFCSNVIDEAIGRKFEIRIKGYKQRTGYNNYIFSRPDLYDVLLSLVPPERIHYNKRVIQISEYIAGVSIRCSDKQEHHGTLLVGADGGYSHVRQCLYEDLSSKGLLPPEDNTGFKNPYSTLFGTTDPLPVEDFKDIGEGYSTFTMSIGKEPYCWTTSTVPGNRICWTVHKQVLEEQYQSMVFRKSNWGPETVDDMVNEVKHLATGYGATIGTLVSYTPKESMARVWAEDKVFNTWHHGRIVLIGDAVHKLLPSAGLGAVNAMQDAVILANCLYDLKSLSREQFDIAFQKYQELRMPHVMEQYEASRRQAKFISNQKWYHVWCRRFFFEHTSEETKSKNFLTGAGYQPQIGFLPMVPVRGTISISGRQYCRRYEDEIGAKSRHLQGNSSCPPVAVAL